MTVLPDLRFIVQVRDPLERLGAGPPEGEHSMDALRAHPFFASIRWDTLWDDSPPPLETGLVRREPAPVDEWDDVGATWDQLVDPDGSGDEYDDDDSVDGLHLHGNHAVARSRMPGDDGIEWAPDAQTFVSPPAIPPEEIGPHGEMPDYARVSLSLAEAVGTMDAVDAVVAPIGDVDGAVGVGIRFTQPTRIDDEDVGPIVGPGLADPASSRPSMSPGPGPGGGSGGSTERASPASSTSTEVGGEGDPEVVVSAPAEVPRRASAARRVPRGVRDSYATSSSDGSPVEKLGAALEAMGIHRGRLRTRSPTPARDASSSAAAAPDWCV
jgi:3-phosphoinositide dependent protein kinase-1